jgi:hypothetical protein
MGPSNGAWDNNTVNSTDHVHAYKYGNASEYLNTNTNADRRAYSDIRLDFKYGRELSF